jgi:hypothetical protein
MAIDPAIDAKPRMKQSPLSHFFPAAFIDRKFVRIFGVSNGTLHAMA